MTDQAIIAGSVVIDDLRTRAGPQDHPLAQLTDAAGLSVAVGAALDFQTHPQPPLALRTPRGERAGTLRPARFTRRVHAVAAWGAGSLDRGRAR